MQVGLNPETMRLVRMDETDGVTMDGPPNTPFVHIRPEVMAMAVAMEQKLRKNDHKTGWKQQPIEAHIKLLKIEMMEFDVALEFLGDVEAAKECVDIANFALIIRDKLMARIETKAQAQHDAQKAAGAGFHQAFIGKPSTDNDHYE